MALDRKLEWEQEEADPGRGVPRPRACWCSSLSKVTPLHAPERLMGASAGGSAVAWETVAARPAGGPAAGDRGEFSGVFLPGMVCGGAAEPSLSMECRADDEPWVLESGSRATLLANFAVTRNYCDGRVATGTGLRKTIAPFDSAASVEERGRPLWLLATLDGRTLDLRCRLEPAGAVAGVGAANCRHGGGCCGGGRQVLATRPGDAGQPDAIQAFAIVNRAAGPLTAPVEFAGPVTALWPSSATSALAVARNPQTGRYAAYVITVVCSM